jgi:hypothetical protein
LGFQAPKKINNSIITKNWPKNDSNVEDDLNEIITLVYSGEMNQLWMMLTWKWIMSST